MCKNFTYGVTVSWEYILLCRFHWRAVSAFFVTRIFLS